MVGSRLTFDGSAERCDPRYVQCDDGCARDDGVGD